MYCVLCLLLCSQERAALQLTNHQALLQQTQRACCSSLDKLHEAFARRPPADSFSPVCAEIDRISADIHGRALASIEAAAAKYTKFYENTAKLINDNIKKVYFVNWV